MFTGLVVERGRIVDARPDAVAGGTTLVIGMSPELVSRLELGASLAVSGCCLTVTRREPDRVEVELSPETLLRTTLQTVEVGDEVNLEPALTVGQPMGGHWVQGHVDGRIELAERIDDREFSTFWWTVPESLRSYLVEKGSVTVDGVSLTVAGLEGDRFSVALIPHTLEATTLGSLQVGSPSNVEVDILAKYVERALAAHLQAPGRSGRG